MVARRKKLLVWWYRTGTALKVALAVCAGVVSTLLLLSSASRDASGNFEKNLLVFVLVNLNIAILFVLAFLVGRNVVKLIFDRRKRILGSKLRLKLVVAFVGLSLIPTVILFVMASDLLNKAMEGWFSSQVEAAVSGSVEVARHHYSLLKEQARKAGERASHDLLHGTILDSRTSQLEAFLETRRKDEGLFSIRLVDASGIVRAEAHSPASVIESFSEPHLDNGALLRSRKEKAAIVLFEEKEPSQFVRGYFPLGNTAGTVLIMTKRISPELASALSSVNDSFKEYEQLKIFRNPLRSGYVLTLSMITGLILFSAIWIGFFIAREISGPIQSLAEGTRAVARGNYDFQIRDMGDDEIGVLVKSFNKMTADLKASRKESERGKLYMETILANLAVGVIGIDTEGRVTFVNAAASSMFGLGDSGPLLGKPVSDALSGPLFASLGPIQEMQDRASPAERELSVMAQGRELKIVCTSGKIVDADSRWLGTVLVFDDITELAKAQHMSAWREVARRIAHEIKNPLTPIQLSAQRLSKYFADRPDPTVTECTQTIVESVDSIKRLANEFSNFARMPTAELKHANLNLVIADTIAPFADNNPGIVFQFIADNRLPEIAIDREQIRRMIINLLDNSIAALAGPTQEFEPKIVIKSNHDRRRNIVTLEISDNGPGISNEHKLRIFEPYFTTKQGGTGLGLAIVSTIISDHQGVIRVYDNKPRGARFVIDLPATHESVTHRRFASA